MVTETLPNVLILKIAQRFKTLGDPVRLKIVNTLMVNTELNVNRLVEATGHQQANISRHLSLLHREGILKKRKEGLNVFYSIKDMTTFDICDLVCNWIKDEITKDQLLLEALKALDD